MFRLVIVLSVLLLFTDSDYPLRIKLFFSHHKTLINKQQDVIHIESESLSIIIIYVSRKITSV